MQKREFQSKRRYLYAVVIGTIIFVIGFFIANSIAYIEYNRISGIQEQSSYDIFQDKLKYTFFNESACSNESFLKLSLDLGAQGRIIDDLENKLGKNNEKVLFRKQFYNLIEIEHLEFVNLLNEKCNSKINTILFFYSNEDKNLQGSEDLGRLISTSALENPETMVYSFDFNLNSELIKALLEKYQVNEPFTLIINQKTKIINPKNILEIEKHLNKTIQ